MSKVETIQALLAHPRLCGPEGVPAGATRDECDAFEVATGLILSPWLRDWYGLVNGEFCGTQTFDGLPTAVRSNRFFHEPEPNALAMRWLSVMADGCGSIYVLDLRRIGDSTPTIASTGGMALVLPTDPAPRRPARLHRRTGSAKAKGCVA